VLVAAALALMGFAGLAEPHLAAFAFSGFALVCLANASPFRFRPRSVPLTIAPGRVAVARGIASFEVRGADVVGATTSLHEGKVALSLTLAARPEAPVTFVFDRDEDAEKVRAALGIAREGRGETSFPTDVPSLVRMGRVLALVALGLLLLPLPFLLASSTDAVFVWMTVGLRAFVLGALSFLQYVPRGRAATRRGVLRPEAAYVPGRTGALALPYADIVGVRSERSSLVVSMRNTTEHTIRTVLPADECAIVASHVEAARRRAQGEGARRAEVVERLAMLQRSNEPIAAWLARVDGVASTIGTIGYRGAALDRDDLRIALEDIDLDVTLRVAAGRVLARVDPEVRVRVAEAATAAPSEPVANVLRHFDAPPDEIARALDEALELDEGDLSAPPARKELRP